MGTSIEIKDLLHLYMNCDVVITKINNPRFAAMTYHKEGDIVKNSPIMLQCAYEGIMDIKPILRKLSDMTEEEAICYIKEVFHHNDTAVTERISHYEIKDGFFTFFTGPKGTEQQKHLLIKNWGPDGNGEWIFNHSHSMADTLWFLNRNFDILGLIAQDKAIHKTV